MATINFPTSPTDGQVFTDGDHTWVFSSVGAGGPGAWKLQAQTVTGPTGPTGATGSASTVTGPTGPTGAAGTTTMAIFSYTNAANTAGGTATAGAMRIRPLNTTVVNTISGCSLSSDQITLPAGTYILRGWGIFYGAITRNRTGFYNLTDESWAAYSASMTGVTSGTASNQSSTIRCIGI